MIYFFIPVTFALTQTTLDPNVDGNVAFKEGAESLVALQGGSGYAPLEEKSDEPEESRAAPRGGYGYAQLEEESDEPEESEMGQWVEEQSLQLQAATSKYDVCGQSDKLYYGKTPRTEDYYCVYDEVSRIFFRKPKRDFLTIPCDHNKDCKSNKCTPLVSRGIWKTVMNARKTWGKCESPWIGKQGMRCREDKDCVNSLCEYHREFRTHTCGRQKLPYYYVLRGILAEMDDVFERNGVDAGTDCVEQDGWEYAMDGWKYAMSNKYSHVSRKYPYIPLTAEVYMAVHEQKKVAVLTFKVDKSFAGGDEPTQADYEALYDKVHEHFLRDKIAKGLEKEDEFDIILTGKEKGGAMPFLARKKPEHTNVARKILGENFNDRPKWKYIVLVRDPPTTTTTDGDYFPTPKFKEDYEKLGAACSVTRIYIVRPANDEEWKLQKTNFMCSAEHWQSITATDDKWIKGGQFLLAGLMLPITGAFALAKNPEACKLTLAAVTGGILVFPAVYAAMRARRKFQRHHQKQKDGNIFPQHGSQDTPQK